MISLIKNTKGLFTPGYNGGWLNDDRIEMIHSSFHFQFSEFGFYEVCLHQLLQLRVTVIPFKTIREMY